MFCGINCQASGSATTLHAFASFSRRSRGERVDTIFYLNHHSNPHHIYHICHHNTTQSNTHYSNHVDG